jgi:diketogulonate reductase-like aldo/keto reductase
MTSRRDMLRAGLLLLTARRAAAATAGKNRMLTKPIPKTGEQLPVIGLGTYRTFDVSDSEYAPLREVLKKFFEAGGRLIDSSPMYGRAEQVVGELASSSLSAAVSAPQRGQPPRPFLATKVWTSGKDEGIAQMRRSMKLMQPRDGAPFDLMQIHNLVDWKTHAVTLRDWQAKGIIRYWGITHYVSSAFDEMERIVRTEKPDFVQLPYSVGMREAENRLLPACAEAKAAVIVDRPFEGGSLFRDVVKRPLPPWANELGCASWAQIFLKFILGHPAVNCPIPATSSPAHMQDDLAAGFGALLDEEQRRRIALLLTGDHR